MKKILYVRITPSEPPARKSFLLRAKEFFGVREDMPYTVKNIYDERNVIIGYLLEYFLSDKNDDERIRQYHETVYNLSRQYECVVAFEDISCTYGYGGEYILGERYILECAVNEIKEAFPEYISDFAGIIAPENADMSLIRRISDIFGYLKIYCSDISYGKRISDELMEYNSTAAVITGDRSFVLSCNVVFFLADDMKDSAVSEKGEYVYPYAEFSSQSDDMKYRAYTENFTPVTLSASFSEAKLMYCEKRLD